MAARRRDEARHPATSVAEHDGGPGIAELRDRRRDVVDAEAHVVQSLAVLVEPGGDRRIGLERLDELQVRVAEIEVREPHRRRRDLLGRPYAKPEALLEERQRPIRAAHHDRNVIEAHG